jgi:hypothetical protein
MTPIGICKLKHIFSIIPYRAGTCTYEANIQKLMMTHPSLHSCSNYRT